MQVTQAFFFRCASKTYECEFGRGDGPPRVLFVSERDASDDFPKLAGAKQVLRVGKGANDLNTACAYVHLAIRKQASSLVRIDGAISQNQFKWRPVGRNLFLRVGINLVSEVDVLLLTD